MSIIDRMAFWRSTETRNVEDPTKPVSAQGLYEWLYGDIGRAASDVIVSVDSALSVPAVFSAVNFLSSTMASLPVHVYRKAKGERIRINSRVAKLLHEASNDETTSFDFFKGLFYSALTEGRGYAYIERNALNDRVESLWNLDPRCVKPERDPRGRMQYRYHMDDGREVIYSAREVIDLPFMMKRDGISHVSPIHHNRDTIGLAIAATQYGSRFFAGGGVPPFAVTGSFKSESALVRAGNDLREAVRKAAKEKRQALTMPEGLEIKSIGAEPEKGQLLETQRFIVEQVARIYNLPPVFLQDLTHGTYSNTEQQDLQLSKHAITRWAIQLEQQLNLKLFGPNAPRFVEVNLKGLQRGAFSERMEGYRTAIQSGFMTPAEVRRLENLRDIEGTDKLFMQGATLPIDQLGETENG